MNNPVNTSVRLLVLPLWIISIFLLGYLAREASTIFLWIVCSLFLFIILDPAGQYLKRKKFPTALTSIFLVVGATALTIGAVCFFGYLFSGMVSELEQSRKLFVRIINEMNILVQQYSAKIPGLRPIGNANADISKVEVVQGSPLGGELGGTILHGLGSAVTILTFSILVPILTFFFLAERDPIAVIVKRAYQQPTDGERAWQKIVTATHAFFAGNLLLGLITYPVFVLLFYLFDVPSFLTLAAIATVFNLVPFAGAVLAGFLPAVALFTQNQNPTLAFSLYGACLAFHFIVADFVTPKVLGAKVNINATTSTIALVVWGELWGAIGLILAIPITAIIKILFEESQYFWLQWIAALMSESTDKAIEPKKTKKQLEAKEQLAPV